METKEAKTFDSVDFFRKVKAALAEKMEDMTLYEQKEFMRKIREGEIKLSIK